MATEQTDNRMGVQLRGVYDGPCFFYDPETHTTEKRFEDEFYQRRGINIDEEIEQWLKQPEILQMRQTYLGNNGPALSH